MAQSKNESYRRVLEWPLKSVTFNQSWQSHSPLIESVVQHPDDPRLLCSVSLSQHASPMEIEKGNQSINQLDYYNVKWSTLCSFMMQMFRYTQIRALYTFLLLNFLYFLFSLTLIDNILLVLLRLIDYKNETYVIT